MTSVAPLRDQLLELAEQWESAFERAQARGFSTFQVAEFYRDKSIGQKECARQLRALVASTMEQPK